MLCLGLESGTFEQHVKASDSIFMIIFKQNFLDFDLSMLKMLSLLTELCLQFKACHRFTLSHLSLCT